jgi:hypothetical protein
MTGSNGVYRSVSFTSMLQHHTGENSIAVDNWAALVIDGGNYRVVSRKGQPGSDKDGQFAQDRSGVPGIWKLQITETGELLRSLVPMSGHVKDILPPPRYIAPDGMVEVARAQNPDDGKTPSWNTTEDTSYVITNQQWWW